MNKLLRKISICTLALCASGIFGVLNTNLQSNTNQVHAMYRLPRSKQMANTKMNRGIKHVYHQLRKMGLGYNHAIALTDIAQFKDPSMNRLTKSSDQWFNRSGYYQLNNNQLNHLARKYHLAKSSVELQTITLFGSKKAVKQFNHHQGSIDKLIHYVYAQHFGATTSQEYEMCDRPLSYVLNVVHHKLKKYPSIQYQRASKARINYIYHQYKKFGFKTKQAKALTAVALRENASLRGNTPELDGTHNGGYGYYQLMKPTLEKLQKNNSKLKISSLRFQTRALFALNSKKSDGYIKAMKKFNHKQGSANTLAKYIYNHYIDNGVSNVFHVNYSNELNQVNHSVRYNK